MPVRPNFGEEIDEADQARAIVETRPEAPKEILPPYLQTDQDRIDAEKSGRVVDKTRERIRAALQKQQDNEFDPT